jgi:hypothetical protein
MTGPAGRPSVIEGVPGGGESGEGSAWALAALDTPALGAAVVRNAAAQRSTRPRAVFQRTWSAH